jgi:hypothetical protein
MNYSEITQVDDSTKEIEKLPLLMHRSILPLTSTTPSTTDRDTLPFSRGYYSLLYNLGSKMVKLNNIFIKMYVETYGKQSVSQSISAIECFTYNLVKAVKLMQSEISFSSDRNTYTNVIINGKAIACNVGYTATIQMAEMLSDYKLITITKGYKVPTVFGGVKRKSGYLTLTQSLINLVEDNVDLHRLRIGTKKSVVLLRDDNKRDLDFTESRYTKEIIRVLNKYNKMMDKHTVMYKDVQLDTGLARIFNNDFNSGGRLYATGGSYQTIPSQTRHLITIDGSETAEVYIKGSHISILHTMVVSRLLKGYDPYERDMTGVAEFNTAKLTFMLDAVDTKHNPFRNLVKVALLIMINADSHRKAIGAMDIKIESQINLPLDKLEDKPIEELALLKFYGLTNINVNELFRRIKKKHEVISEYFCSGAGVWLQKMEGDIFTKVMDRCVDESIPVLIIHDSARSKVNDVKRVGAFIEDAWLDVVGDTLNLQLEYEF